MERFIHCITKIMLNKTEINLNDENKYGDTLISWAVYGDQSLIILNLLIEYKANYKMVNKNKENLLHSAVSNSVCPNFAYCFYSVKKSTKVDTRKL